MSTDVHSPSPVWVDRLYIIWTIVFIVALIICLGLGYAFQLTFGNLWFIPVTVYGLTMMMHLFLQFIFAFRNYQIISAIQDKPMQLKIGMQVVGHQEERTLFENSLLSLKLIALDHHRDLIVVVDGNEEADRYMSDIFRGVFNGMSEIRTIPYVLAELSAEERAQRLQELRSDKQFICLLQPKRGKREALYTAFQMHIDRGADAVFTTDSDTRVEPDAIEKMAQLLKDPGIGAVTGNVAIDNIHNWLSFLSSLRYWFAFNLERAAQSYFGVVSCVSGPLGLYRREVLQKILDPWVHQTFLNQRCTYGDDRHLTNRVLELGKKVVFTPYATCKTETPTQYRRWLLQQTRWSKSYYREFLLNAQWFHKHPLWLAYDLVYQALYPFFLLFSIGLQIGLYLQYNSLFFLKVWIATILLGGFLRVLFSFIFTRDLRFIFFMFYGFLYIFGLLPSKLFAVATLWDVQWGTSPRKHIAMSLPWNQFLVIYVLLYQIIRKNLLPYRREIQNRYDLDYAYVFEEQSP